MARYRERYTRDHDISNHDLNNQDRSTGQSMTSTRRQILKGFGTIGSKGVSPSGLVCTGEGADVEFSLNIYQKEGYYYGEVYLVDYDSRRKINSNQLIYFNESSLAQIICIFCVESPNYNCTYQLIVSVSPSNCGVLANGMFFAYVPAIYNQELNIGGLLKTGEIIICDCCEGE